MILRKIYNVVPHDPENGTFGDCHRNCIAMCLGLMQEEVPHFYSTDDSDAGNLMIEDFLRSRDKVQGNIIFPDGNSVEEVMAATGFMMRGVPLVLAGKSGKANCNHSIVILDGKVWCDPSGSGIVGPCEAPNPPFYYWVTFFTDAVQGFEYTVEEDNREDNREEERG